jgi:hypothetical protein
MQHIPNFSLPSSALPLMPTKPIISSFSPVCLAAASVSRRASTAFESVPPEVGVEVEVDVGAVVDCGRKKMPKFSR